MMPGAILSSAAIFLSAHAFDGGKIGPPLEPSKPRTYVTVDLEYSAFESARHRLEKKIGLKLGNRGEAHITVVTPPEYKILATKLEAKEIESLIEANLVISKNSIKPVCIGQGVAKTDQTWFVVVEMESAKVARKQLADAFVKAGGAPVDFNADEFHPHVTLGFDKRDLHLQDGVVKDTSSCKFRLHRSNHSGRR